MTTLLTVIAIAALLGGAIWYSFKDKDNRKKGTTKGSSQVENDNTKPKNRR